MWKLLTRNLLLAALALNVPAIGCASDEASTNGHELGTGDNEAGTGGSCDDILLTNCEDLAGDKVAQCQEDLEASHAACVEWQECFADYKVAAEACGDKPADAAGIAVFEECLANATAQFPCTSGSGSGSGTT